MQNRTDSKGVNELATSEFDLIDKYFKPLAPSGAPAFSLANDGAVQTPISGQNIVYTMDTLVAGVHFFENDPPDLVAKKALRVNLSDLASMAARPNGYLLSIAIPSDQNNIEEWIRLFAVGLAEDQDLFGIELWGGDTVSTAGPITITVTAIGEVDEGLRVTRSGAEIGDGIYVSGTLGDAAAGLALIKEKSCDSSYDYLINRYRLPQPRLKISEKLAHVVTSMMDISDGLVGDMAHICRHSMVGAQIIQQKIPFSREFGNLLETKSKYSDLCWNGGDDYELLFTANAKNDGYINQVSEQCGVKLTKIGLIFDGRHVKLLDDDGAEVDIKDKGFRHF